MPEKSFPAVKAAGAKRLLNVRKDPPDIRDRMYEPALIRLEPKLDCPDGAVVLNQGREGACTGFGLAAVINILNAGRSDKPFLASARMLYEMAKKHDEWPGEKYAGSSCRGAIRGWKNMGVCGEKDWPYDESDPGELTVERAKAARNMPLGAYYRLRPEVTDYHAALNETRALYVSAFVHSGWFNPKPGKNGAMAVIEPDSEIVGGHAFAIVGYNSEGFLVQNSWGTGWGSGGFAIWPYEDWLENISDGWVFRLAIPTPRIHGITARAMETREAEFFKPAPKRMEIAGHFVHFDDGAFKEKGDYWSKAADIRETAGLIRETVEKNKYEHFMIYAHGGLNTPKDSARRIAAMKKTFKDNKVYPFHIMYDTGLGEEIKDAVLRAGKSGRKQGWAMDPRASVADFGDWMIEDLLRKPVTPVWEEMKLDARLPFEKKENGVDCDGLFVIKTFAQALKDTGIEIHLVGHSTGSVLIGHLLDALDTLDAPGLVKSCSLMAPACAMDFYMEHYAPRLGGGQDGRIGLPVLDVYALTDKIEKDDNVALVYRKSLLYLVSRALERQPGKPLLGMQRYLKKLDDHPALNLVYSDGRRGISRSTTHGGFDNDPWTMNAILTRILKKKPKHPFKKQDIEKY